MSDSRETELEDLFAVYVERLNRGERLDAESILAENPVLGLELLELLEDFLDSGENGTAESDLGALGDYTLRRRIGRGGMGVVYEAWEGSMARRVALKVLPQAVAADTRAVTRFVREAQAAGKLSHPNVVSVFAMGVKERTPYFAMEYVEGETLAQVLASLQGAALAAPTPFGANRAELAFYSHVARAFAGVADGLQHAHSHGVVHRDIKPSNLILDRSGAELRLRILDFGLARVESEEPLTLSGDTLGTPQYMSPEQARRRRIAVDHRTDVWSLGATLYEALAGVPPFRGKDREDTLSQILDRDPVAPRRLNPHLPKDLETIVLKCLRKDADDRYRTAEAMAQDLRRFVRGDAVEARPQTRLERLSGRLRRRKRLVAVTALGIVLVSVCGILALLLLGERSRSRALQGLEYERRLVGAAMTIFRAELSRPWWEGHGQLAPLGIRPQTRLRRFAEERHRRALEGTLIDIDEVIATLPQRFEGHYFRGRALAWLGRRDESIAALEAALLRRGGFLPAERLLAEERGGVGGTDEAAPTESASPWNVAWERASSAALARDWPAARGAYDALVEIEEGGGGPYPGSALEALLGRGVARLATHDLEGAKRDFWAARTFALARWGELLEPSLLLAKTYVMEGDFESAQSTLERCWQRAADRDEAALWIVFLLRSFEGQVRTDALASQWIPRLADRGLRALVEVEFDATAGNLKAAIGARRTLLNEDPQDFQRLLDQAQDLRRLLWIHGREKLVDDSSPEFRELVQAATTAIELRPQAPAALLLASDIARARRDVKRAEELERRAEAVVTDSGRVARAPRGELGGVFAAVERLPLYVNTPFEEAQPSISGDELTLAFASNRPGGIGRFDIYLAERTGLDEPFTTVRCVVELNSALQDFATFLAPDGQTLYYMSNRTGNYDMFLATRARRGDSFSNPQPVGGINTGHHEGGLSLTADGLHACFVSDRPGSKGGRDLWLAHRESPDAEFVVDRNIAEINSPYEESCPSLSGDGLSLLWSDLMTWRPGGAGGLDIWFARRTGLNQRFGEVENFAWPVNAATDDFWPRLSQQWPRHGASLYFCRYHHATGSDDICRATWRSGSD